MGLIGGALTFHHLWLAVFGLFLLGVQCAIFSPAKQGIIKEIVTATKISAAVGIVEVTAIASMLIGGLAGGALYDVCFSNLANPWRAAEVTMAVLSGLALLSLVAGYQVQKTPAHTNQPFRAALLWEHFGQLRDVWSEQPIRLCVLGISYFYGLAGALYLTLFEVSASVHQNGVGTASQTGLYAATLGVGIICGSFLVTRMTTHQVEIGLIPIGSCGLIVGALVAGVAYPKSVVFLAALFFMGLAGALFVVPLNAHLQEQVEPARRGRILSANNLFINLFGILAVLFQYFDLGRVWSSRAQTVAHLRHPDGAGDRLYRLCDAGRSASPGDWFGGTDVLPGDSSWTGHHARHRGRSLVAKSYFLCGRRDFAVGLPAPDPVSDLRSNLSTPLAALGAAPAGGDSDQPQKSPYRHRDCRERSGQGRSGLSLPRRGPDPDGHAAKAESRLRVDRAQGAGARDAHLVGECLGLGLFLLRRPFFLEDAPVRAASRLDLFRHSADGDRGHAGDGAALFYDLSAEAFESRPELKSHVGYEAIRGLRKKFFMPVVTDAYAGNRTLTGGKLLAVSFALAWWLKKNVTERRIGIVLPPGLGAAIANLGVILSGKIPVNLNFSIGHAANESAMARAGIQRLITSPALVDQIKDFPWLENRIDIAELCKSFSPLTLKRMGLMAWLFPAPVLRRWLGLPKRGDREEAGLLFTSGSAGDPKGVVLTHRNLLANTAQIGAILAQTDLKSILGALPVFHSFGFTVTFWWPLLGGPRVVTYPSPLDGQKLIETIEKHKLELLVTTPTFLRVFLRKPKPEQLASLKMIVTGAEKLPLDLLNDFGGQIWHPGQ